MHSEVFNFGILKIPPKEFLKTILTTLFEIIGKEGTLIMPTFSYSFCNNKDYDKNISKCTVGALNEFFHKQWGGGYIAPIFLYSLLL